MDTDDFAVMSWTALGALVGVGLTAAILAGPVARSDLSSTFVDSPSSWLAPAYSVRPLVDVAIDDDGAILMVGPESAATGWSPPARP